MRVFLLAFLAALAGLAALLLWAPSRPATGPDIAAMADGWQGVIAFDAGYDALDPNVSAASEAGGAGFDPADPFGGLPRTDGHEEVAGLCSACHSLRIVAATRATPARWAELVTLMREKHGMGALDPETHALVLAYLARELGPAAAP